MAKQDLSRKPDQHENQLAALARIEELLKRPIKIEIKCSCCADTQKEILAIVKEILKRLQEGGISEAEENALAKKLSESSDSLSDAVEANQP